MEEFLKVIADTHLSTHGDLADESFNTFYKPFLEKLEGIVSPDLYEELEELFTNCSLQNNLFYCTEGVKLAAAILEKKYVPVV